MCATILLSPVGKRRLQGGLDGFARSCRGRSPLDLGDSDSTRGGGRRGCRGRESRSRTEVRVRQTVRQSLHNLRIDPGGLNGCRSPRSIDRREFLPTPIMIRTSEKLPAARTYRVLRNGYTARDPSARCTNLEVSCLIACNLGSSGKPPPSAQGQRSSRHPGGAHRSSELPSGWCS